MLIFLFSFNYTHTHTLLPSAPSLSLRLNLFYFSKVKIKYKRHVLKLCNLLYTTWKSNVLIYLQHIWLSFTNTYSLNWIRNHGQILAVYWLRGWLFNYNSFKVHVAKATKLLILFMSLIVLIYCKNGIST